MRDSCMELYFGNAGLLIFMANRNKLSEDMLLSNLLLQVLWMFCTKTYKVKAVFFLNSLLLFRWRVQTIPHLYKKRFLYQKMSTSSFDKQPTLLATTYSQSSTTSASTLKIPKNDLQHILAPP